MDYTLTLRYDLEQEVERLKKIIIEKDKEIKELKDQNDQETAVQGSNSWESQSRHD